MAKKSIRQLAADVATLLGETLLPENLPEECPFPSIENRVRILAPGILADLTEKLISTESAIDLSAGLYADLVKSLAAEIAALSS